MWLKTLQAPPEQEVAVSVLPTPVPTPEPVMAATAPTAGSCVDWMQQAGITDMVDASNIFMAESGCRPTATNPSSAAFGVCQSLPGSKMAVSGADWQTNPVTQMRWCDSYAQSRYGGWSNAWAFWSKCTGGECLLDK